MQIQDLDARKVDSRGNWGDSGGTDSKKILTDSSKITGSRAASAEMLEIGEALPGEGDQLKLIVTKLVGLVKFVHVF